jgi:hypothetical protein
LKTNTKLDGTKIIVGDSWAVGEWGFDGTSGSHYNIVGPSFGSYTSKWYNVINLGRGGNSNRDSLITLESFLNQFTPLDKDSFYFIVTDPLRDLDYKSFLLSIQTTLYQSIMELVIKDLTTLDKIAKQHNIVVNLIGGLCDLTDLDVAVFTNLKSLIPSWIQIHHAEHVSSVINEEYWAELGKNVKQYRSDLLEEWINLSDVVEKQYQLTEKSQYFRKEILTIETDGCHPNRHSHIIVGKIIRGVD